MTANLGSNTVESSTSELVVNRKPPTKSSEHRRITKPIMEKKRRARINNSLNELKELILDALNKDPTRHSKLEKADILEMTVRHLQKLQRQQVTVAIVNDTTILNKYRAGFSECAQEVGRYMGNMEGFDQSIRQRILGHLNHCMNSLNQMAVNAQFGLNTAQTNQTTKTAFPGMVPPAVSNSSQLHLNIPLVHTTGAMFPNHHQQADLNNNHRPYSHGTDDLISKPQLSTPPSSASSTSSHFAFNLNLHSPSSKLHFSPHPISLTTQDIFFRKQSGNPYSPGSSSYASGQMSPLGSEQDMEMVAVDMRAKPIPIVADENVWRPW